jgi:PAS domain S-box-containing protein
MEFFQQLLSPDFMPHGFCYLWDPRIVWLHVISDGLIALSYYCIPVVLIYFIRKNRDLPFNRIFWMFGTFILACGTTHLMEIWNVWHGSYLVAGVIKAITAVVSVVTAAMFIPLVPMVIALPGRVHLQLVNCKLQAEIAQRARAEQALQESLATSETALKELADQKFALDQHAIVAVTDVQGTITYANDKFCAISQYSKEELIGRNHRILNSGYHPKEFFQQMYSTIAKGQVWRGEMRNHAKDGSIYWVDATIVPFVNSEGKPRQYVAIRADITERKRAEEEIRQLNAELERKVEELARSNADLEQFAYVASHDLQEPLRMVAAYTQLLAERYRGKLDENADKFIGYASEGALRMQTLIQDLLAFSRIGRNDAAGGRVDCDSVMDEVLLNLGSAIRESGAVVTHAALPAVWADRSQMTQVLQNLIGNAIKFRGNEAPVISVQAEKAGARWRFSVSDNGIGIAPEHAESIFVVFQRLHARTEYPGNGIGLAICKKIVERNGGKIWVEARAAHGSVFKFTLPGDDPAEKELCGEEVLAHSL